MDNNFPQEKKYSIPAPYTNNTSNQTMFSQNYNNIPNNQNQEINQYYNSPTQNNQYNNYSNQNHQNNMTQNNNSRGQFCNGPYFTFGFFVGVVIGVVLLKIINFI